METLSTIAYDLTPIIQALVALAAAACSCFLIPYIKGKLTAEQLAQLTQWIQIAVAAAEQIFTGSGMGQAKKGYVLDFLEKNHCVVDEVKVDAMIESAVFEINSKK